MGDHFLAERNLIGGNVDLLGQRLFDAGDVLRIHMLRRIDTESGNAKVPQIGKVCRLDVLHAFAAGVDVPHGTQSAVLHFVGVRVVANRFGAIMEIAGHIAILVIVAAFGEVIQAHRRVTTIGAVVFGAGNAFLVIHPGHIGTGGVVEHHIGDHAHVAGRAGLDHVREFLTRAEARIQIVADRLVDGPPLRALHGFHRRADLHVAHAFRPIGLLTFLRDGVPGLLERDHGHVALRIGAPGIGERAVAEGEVREHHGGRRDHRERFAPYRMLLHRMLLPSAWRFLFSCVFIAHAPIRQMELMAMRIAAGLLLMPLPPVSGSTT